MTLDKTSVIRHFLENFEREHAALTQSAKSAHEAATHEESKSEDKHDTRATEASYLAKGQAVRVAEIERMILEFKSYLDQAHRSAQQIQPGTLVELESEKKISYSFFAHSGGGTQISLDEKTIVVTTPKSPLGEALNGLSPNDTTEVETKTGIKEYLVRSVR